MAGSVVEWNSPHPQIRRFNHGTPPSYFASGITAHDPPFLSLTTQAGARSFAEQKAGHMSCVLYFSYARSASLRASLRQQGRISWRL
jgi:hypothetical protein